MQKNGRLIVLVAAVAVAAVVVGGVIASQGGPRSGSSSAAPLVGRTATPRPVADTPSTTPAATPTPTATASSAPIKVKLELSKLPRGRDPQVPYLVGREVRGGAGQPIKIPGTEQIQEVARLGSAVLAVVSKGSGTELLKVESTGEVNRTPDVTGIVTTADGSAAAYATTRTTSGGEALTGSTIYATVDGQVRKLQLRSGWDVRVIAFLDGKVYYRMTESRTANAWKLFEWPVGSTTATEVKTVPSPTGLSGDGRIAGSMSVLTDNGTCSAFIEVATGKRLWRTCDYQVKGFTPDGSTVIGAPSIQDGYADTTVAALNAKSGSLIREWTGTFRQTVAEDDQHFLMLADDGPETKAAIIRCNTTTGACELATPLALGELKIGS